VRIYFFRVIGGLFHLGFNNLEFDTHDRGLLKFMAAPCEQDLKAMIDELQKSYCEKRAAIRARLDEFTTVWRKGDDARLFEELVFCIFTAGASARMGLNSIERVRPYLQTGNHRKLVLALSGAHRYPVARSGYIIHTRDYLRRECNLRLRERLESFGQETDARRDFFAANPGIKGIGYKEASHFLRNIGYRGYAILDKHILRTLHECGVLDSPYPPTTKKKYLATEEQMRKFAIEIKINFDELDLLLWSNKTGEILK
jgi:N-glycosylase/DNA lyase